jgi:hypothetical protein
MSQPLITFFVCAYKQERFIRETVAGALAQTYSPLEIILSDDCSPDRTFEIMQEMAGTYTGPHKIILNRCEQNGGIARHINAVVKIAKGELLVGNAGDDISVPERTQKIFEAWEKSGGKAMSIFSNAAVIDIEGKRVSEKFLAPVVPQKDDQIALCTVLSGWPLRIQPLKNPAACLKNWVLGATHAFQRKTFEVFGPLHDGVMQEDLVIPLRSQILGEIVFINEPLGLYRRHAGNVCPDVVPFERQQQLAIRFKRQQQKMDQNRLADLRKAKELGLMSEALFSEYERILSFDLQCLDVDLMFRDKHWLRAMTTGIRYLVVGNKRFEMSVWLFRKFSAQSVKAGYRKLKSVWCGMLDRKKPSSGN